MTSTTAELSEMGEETEYACETMSDYRDVVMGLTHNKVDLLGDDGQYKSTYQMLKEISGVWEDMNSMEQSALMKTLFGVRQSNIGAAILGNFDVAESSLNAALNSEGSAEKELQNWNKGIEASVAHMKTQFQELSQSVFSSDFLKGGADLITSLMSGVTAGIDTIGIPGLLAGGLGATGFFKNLD